MLTVPEHTATTRAAAISRRGKRMAAHKHKTEPTWLDTDDTQAPAPGTENSGEVGRAGGTVLRQRPT
jgi:hypothetical protein